MIFSNLWLGLQALLLLFTVLSFALIVVYSLQLGISPMPSSRQAREAILAMLKQHAPNATQAYELGAGWGSLAFPMARQFPQLRVVAIERSPIPYLWLRIRQKLHPKLSVEAHFEDFFLRRFDGAELIVCYLYTGAMERLQAKFREELPEGAVIISNTFRLPGQEPVQVVTLRDLYRTKIYVYKIQKP